MSSTSGRLREFLALNERLCGTIERRLPQAQVDLHEEYERTVADYINAFTGPAIVADIGGGKAVSLRTP